MFVSCVVGVFCVFDVCYPDFCLFVCLFTFIKIESNVAFVFCLFVIGEKLVAQN